MSMFEDVPVHGRRSDLRNSNVAAHQRNLSLDFRHVTGTSGPPAGCGHQRNRSLDSVLQRIPEDMTPTSPEGAPLRLPIEVSAPRLALPPEVPAGSDDSGIHTPPDGTDEERPQPPAAARSRESLDSGNPEETEKPPDPPDDEGPINATVEPNSVIQETVACNKKGFSFGSIRGKFFNKSSSNSEDKNKVSGHSITKNVGEGESKRSEIKFGSGRWWKDDVNAEDQLDSTRFQSAADNYDSISSYNICSSPTDDEPVKPNPSWSQIDEFINFQSADYCKISPNYTVHPNLADNTPANKPTTSCSQNDEDSEECASHSTNKNSLNTIQSKPQDDKNAHDPIHTRLQDVDLSKKKDVLLRLFESKLFDMSMAISYLYNSKEPGVQSYLANKLFSFPTEEVDFYLPQLATMYIEMGDLADVLKPYLVYRCKQSAEFSLRLAWLLTAFGGDARRSRATKLRDSVLAEEIRPVARRGHHRSQSDASALRLATPTGRYLGDLASGRAFDNGCLCGEQCSCGALRLAPEIQFLTALTNIGRRLAGVPDKERRKGRLRDELLQLDLNLPARVWLPLHPQPHYVLRIPPQAAAVLNSKDKAPYIMYVEVLETEGHEPLPPLPPRLLPPAPPAPHSPPIRHTKSEENLVPEWPALALYSGMDDVDTGDCWSHDDDEPPFAPRWAALDTLSQVSAVSTSSCGSRESVVVGAGDVRRRLADATAAPPPNVFRNDPTDPSATALKESWESKLSRMRSTSPYGSLPGWKLLGCIVKVGDDLRQEMLAVQILRKLQSVWDLERVPLKLNPYEILCLDKECGLIQPVLNSVSLHQIKKQSGKSLVEWLQLEHGAATSEGFLRAQNNFVRSAAAYALTSYILQLKDRHNGNILLDSAGHIVHIDFGFIFSTSPKNLGFESSPFKLTAEFVEVMGGESSDLFAYFKILMLRGLIAARKHCDPIIHLVELMRSSGQLPCLRSSHAVAAFRARFHHGRTDAQLQALVDRMVRDALRSLSTRLYDNYQYYTNGIL